MNLQQLEYFKLVAEKENYTSVAKFLGVTQSSLSHAIAKLEKELHVALFVKDGRKIRLTQNGKEFYTYVVQALDILEDGKNKMLELSGDKNYTIKIGHIHNAARDFIAQVIGQYRLASDILTTFELEQDATANLLDALVNKALDIALTSKVTIEGITDHLEFVPVYKEDLVVIAPKKHRLSGAEKISLLDLDGENFISYHKTSGLHQLILDSFKESAAEVNIIAEEILDTSICRLVSMGKGIAIVPDTIDLLDYDISVIPINETMSRRFIYLCWCSDRTLPEHVLSFIRFTVAHYQYDQI